MDKGKLIKVDTHWAVLIPEEAAFALGYHENAEIDLQPTVQGLVLSTPAPNSAFLLAAATEVSEHSGAFKKLSKR